jgi:hypothetical protein
MTDYNAAGAEVINLLAGKYEMDFMQISLLFGALMRSFITSRPPEMSEEFVEDLVRRTLAKGFESEAELAIKAKEEGNDNA